MEPEEKKTRRTSAAKGSNVAKKTTAKKSEAKHAKVPEKKASTRKQATAQKTTSAKIEKADKIEETMPKDAVVKEYKEQANKKQENKKNKRYIDISLGAIVCAIIIIALLILNIKLGKHAYKILKNESTSSNNELENNISVTQEIGNVLSKTNELVEEMKENITFSSNVTASIYNTQGFNNSTISNELKLILGWAKADDGKKLKSINEKHEQVEALENEVMGETIKKVLGPNTQYIAETFNNAKITTFASSSKEQGEISYSDGLYTSILREEQEQELQPLIYQEIQKVVKYSEKAIVYVKVAFINTRGNNYYIYKNFQNNKFSEKLAEIEPNELFEGVSYNQYTGEGSVTVNENSALDSIRIKLDTYKYTFTFDETLQEYYLSEFGKDNT